MSEVPQNRVQLSQTEYDVFKVELCRAYEICFNKKLHISKYKYSKYYKELILEIEKVSFKLSAETLINFFYSESLTFDVPTIESIAKFINTHLLRRHYRNTIHQKVNELVREIKEKHDNNDSDYFKKFVAPGLSKNLSEHLLEGAEIDDELIESLHPLCDVCVGCGKNDDLYDIFKISLDMVAEVRSGKSSHSLDDIKLFSNMAKSAYNFDQKEVSYLWATKVPDIEKYISQFKEDKTKHSVLKSLVIHDDKDLTWAKFNVYYRENHMERDTLEIANAYGCKACLAVGMNLSDASNHIEEFEAAITNIRPVENSVKPNFRKNIITLSHLYHQYENEKHDLFKKETLRVKTMKFADEIKDSAYFKETSNKVSKSFVYAVLAEFTGKSQYYSLAQTTLAQVEKYKHCLFDLKRLRKYLQLPSVPKPHHR